MSVIYQSLTKLRSSPLVETDRQPGVTADRHRFARSWRFFGPRVLMLTALVFICGISASYGIYQMQHEPAPIAEVNVAPRKMPASYSSSPGLSAGKTPVAASDDETKGQSTRFGQAHTAKEGPQQKPVAARAVMAKKTKSDPSTAPAVSEEGTAVAGIDPHVTGRSATRERAAADDTQPAVAHIERMRRANMRRSLNISRLIAEIQQSMQSSDSRRTEQLLRQLAALKGRNDPYVMKLRSYWYTQQGELDRAAAVLKEVLQRNPNDLEAGLNMAIIDIKSGRYRQANDRLARLREIYPEDTRIPELMEKLKS